MSYDVGRARRRLEVGRTAVVEDLDVRQLAHTWGGTCGTCGGATVRVVRAARSRLVRVWRTCRGAPAPGQAALRPRCVRY
eukprot:scaffold27684_cov52-Phaeocystis_antarctica.AAC.2